MARVRFNLICAGVKQAPYVSARIDDLTLWHLFNLASMAVTRYRRDYHTSEVAILDVFVTDHDDRNPPEEAWRRIPLEEPAFNFI